MKDQRFFAAKYFCIFMMFLTSNIYRTSFHSNILGSANNLCKKQGTFVWDQDDHFFFFCTGPNQNAGCQECPAKELFYSLHCSACLTRDDGMCTFFFFQRPSIKFITSKNLKKIETFFSQLTL